MPYDKEQTIKEIYYNVEISKATFEVQTKDEPGIQSDIIIQTKNFRNIIDMVFGKLCETFNIDTNTPYHIKYWTYISDNTNQYSGYHIHTFNEYIFQKNDYTWVFYIQIPENLIGDDGKILFQTEDNVEHKILPENGDLFFFPTDLPHRPEINKNSEKPRIVLAGNFALLDFNKKIKKREKTLF